MQRVMAIYDVEPFYAKKFAEFANEKEKTPFTAIAFSSLARLKTYAEKQQIELLLIGDDVPEEDLIGLNVGQIIHLSETGIKENDGAPSVYKYQASDRVLREVMACYQVRAEPEWMTDRGISSQVIGVYSPVGRCGKTGFAMTLGQVMARETKVLLICLEDVSAMSCMTGTEYRGTLSDLLYYFRMGEYSRLRLGSVTYNWNGLDYVPPAAYAEDLKDVTGEELARLLQMIAKDGGYDRILVDLGHLGRGMEEVLELCSKIYSPVIKDPVSSMKTEEWKRYLEVSGRSGLLRNVQFLELPFTGSYIPAERYLEQLLWGEMGDLVRGLIHGGEKGER